MRHALPAPRALKSGAQIWISTTTMRLARGARLIVTGEVSGYCTPRLISESFARSLQMLTVTASGTSTKMISWALPYLVLNFSLISWDDWVISSSILSA